MAHSKLTKEMRIGFRDQLREARCKAQKDAEAFEGIIFVLDRLGTFLSGAQRGLGRNGKAVAHLAEGSPHFSEIPNSCRAWHTPFVELYDLVRQARNDAMHEGAAARHATNHAIELSLVLEDALMNGYDKVSDFMVRNPVCAAMWQPLSFIRQTMLVSSFSYLPVNVAAGANPEWRLISSLALAQYLRIRTNGKRTQDLLVRPLHHAAGEDGIGLIRPRIYEPDIEVKKVLQSWRAGDGQDDQPVLIIGSESVELLGILTPYDLL